MPKNNKLKLLRTGGSHAYDRLPSMVRRDIEAMGVEAAARAEITTAVDSLVAALSPAMGAARARAVAEESCPRAVAGRLLLRAHMEASGTGHLSGYPAGAGELQRTDPRIWRNLSARLGGR